MFDKKAVYYFSVIILLLVWGGIGVSYGKPDSTQCFARYDNARFMVNNSFYIDLRSGPEEILIDHEYAGTQWFDYRYYLLSNYPIRLISVQDKFYSVQFLFRNAQPNDLTIVLYDLRIEGKTSMADLELYMQSHRIEYSRGSTNISTPFASFYFEGNRLGLVEFKVAVLRHYSDYYFLKTGERPWWVGEN